MVSDKAGWCLLGALALVSLSCGGPPHAAEEKYFLIATNIKLPYWQAAGAGLRAAAVQLGVKCDFVGPDTYDPRAQQEEFRRVMAQKPTGILVSAADPELMNAEIDRAIAQGIPVITIDSDAPASQRLLFIGTNNSEAGSMGARVTAAKLGGKGNVVVYTMPEQVNLAERLHGYRDGFGAHPQIKIAEIINVRGDPRIAFDKTTEIVTKRKPLPDAFICLEATACEEVAEVLDRQRVLGKVVVAMDADRGTLEWIQKGVIAATIAQKPYTMAFVGLKMLDDLHHHKLAPLAGQWAQNPFAPIPTFVDTGATLIDNRNVNRFFEAQQSATEKRGG
jgi:ribose transport system substrate-binding protein